MKRCAFPTHSIVAWSLLFSVAALSPGLIACDTPPPQSPTSYTEDAKKAFDRAMVEFDAHNWLDAQVILREVKRKYGYSKYGRLAELRIADADFEQDKFAESIRGYKQFIHLYRGESADAVYARARIAEAQYREINDSFLLPASEERDQSVVRDAYRDLRAFVKDHSGAKEAPRICGLLYDVSEKLVRHELSIAEFYLARDKFDAAIARLQTAIRNYAGAVRCKPDIAAKTDGAIAEAFIRLGETYLKIRKPDDARVVFVALLETFPESGHTAAARGYLERLSKPKG